MNLSKSINRIMFALALVCVSTQLFAQTPFKVASNSSSGTYDRMLGEIIAVCNSDELEIVSADVKGGAVGNLDALYNNKVNAAFMHSDVFMSSAQADPNYNRFQTLVALYPEPIHVLALKVSKTTENGALHWGKAAFGSLAETKGYKVGAAGGGVVTARILQGQGEGGFSVVPYNDGNEVIAALDKGEIAAAIFVGAAPLPNLEKLDKQKYKLIPIGATIENKVQGVYRPASVNYPGLTSGPLHTLAPMATLMTKKYTTPAMIDMQRKFRDCFNTHLGELKDGHSPNWEFVEAGDHGVLTWYEIPPAGPAAPKKK